MIHPILQSSLNVPVIPNIPSVGYEEILSMVAINYLSVLGIQAIKWSRNKAFNWISENTPWITRALVLATSSLTALGIHQVWESNSGNLIITLNLWIFLHGLKHIIANYGMQHGWWKILYSEQEDVRRAAEPLPKQP